MCPKFSIMGPETAPKIKFKGIFDFNSVYAAVKEWFQKHGFEWQEGKHYVDTNGKERSFHWYGFRNDTHYLRVWVDISIDIKEADDVEVIHEGKKKKFLKGNMLMIIDVLVETDYEKQFEKNRFFILLRQFYENYIYHNKLLLYVDGLEHELHELYDYLKKKMDMASTDEYFKDNW